MQIKPEDKVAIEAIEARNCQRRKRRRYNREYLRCYDESEGRQRTAKQSVINDCQKLLDIIDQYREPW